MAVVQLLYLLSIAGDSLWSAGNWLFVWNIYYILKSLLLVIMEGRIAWIIKNMEMPTVSGAINPEWFMLLMITFLTNLYLSVVSMEAQQFPWTIILNTWWWPHRSKHVVRCDVKSFWNVWLWKILMEERCAYGWIIGIFQLALSICLSLLSYSIELRPYNTSSPGVGARTLLRNVRKLQPDCTASHIRKQCTS